MNFGEKSNLLLLLLLLCTLLFAELKVKALSYDYSASIECLTNPDKPQYGGGIIKNPDLNQGLEGWSSFGNAKLEHRESSDSRGNKFLVAHSRNQPCASMSQKIYLKKNKLYTLSAWVQVSEGSVPVTAIFKTSTGFKHAGAVVAESKCWSMLKGGLTADATGLADLFFESKNTSVEIWVDSISMQPFTQQQWRSQQRRSIQKTRKSNVRIQAVDKQGKPLPDLKVSIEQKRASFPFGCAINKNIINNAAYQNWFTPRFGVTTFEDEMKWYSNENTPGHEDYTEADAMLQFTKKNNIAVRGHNIFWDHPKYQTEWVKSLSPADLSKAAEKRINSIMSRYKGQVIAWDVVNENLHFSFFESKLGKNASAAFFNTAHRLDGATTLFMNEFNTIENSTDEKSTPAKYLEKIREINQYPGNNNIMIGIGLQGHFGVPNIPYMRSSIDTLAATGSPIWLTEVDVKNLTQQAQYLEQVLREAHSHPKISGIIMWSAWRPTGCYSMCLTDANFKNFPAGDVVDKLLREWGGSKTLEGKTDANGFFEASLFYGDYQVKINDHHTAAKNISMTQSFKLAPADGDQATSVLLQVSA